MRITDGYRVTEVTPAECLFCIVAEASPPEDGQIEELIHKVEKLTEILATMMNVMEPEYAKKIIEQVSRYEVLEG